MSDDSSQEENGFALVRAAAKGDASKMAELLSNRWESMWTEVLTMALHFCWMQLNAYGQPGRKIFV